MSSTASIPALEPFSKVFAEGPAADGPDVRLVLLPELALSLAAVLGVAYPKAVAMAVARVEGAPLAAVYLAPASGRGYWSLIDDATLIRVGEARRLTPELRAICEAAGLVQSAVPADELPEPDVPPAQAFAALLKARKARNYGDADRQAERWEWVGRLQGLAGALALLGEASKSAANPSDIKAAKAAGLAITLESAQHLFPEAFPELANRTDSHRQAMTAAERPSAAPVLALVGNPPVTPALMSLAERLASFKCASAPGSEWSDASFAELLRQYEVLHTQHGQKSIVAHDQLALVWGYKAGSIRTYLNKARARRKQSNRVSA